MSTNKVPGSEVLGLRARDLVTCIEGVITARTEHLNGCVRFCIQPQVNESAPDKPATEVEWVDAAQMQIVGVGVRYEMGLDRSGKPVAATGGPVKSEG